VIAPAIYNHLLLLLQVFVRFPLHIGELACPRSRVVRFNRCNNSNIYNVVPTHQSLFFMAITHLGHFRNNILFIIDIHNLSL